VGHLTAIINKNLLNRTDLFPYCY